MPSHVGTVSPTYAREITTEALGAGLHGLTQGLAERAQLTGIVNGIDESWDPSLDPYLPHHFDAEDLRGKETIADMVRTGLCLAPSDGPLFGVVSRLVPQKGLDIVAEAANDIVRSGGQIAILGLGEPATEQMLNKVARRHRDHIGLLVGFNEPMARRIVGGSDFCLMPSRFEPCGLTQMQAQRYGTLPIAHATGGLADTIEDGATGFLFSDFSPEDCWRRAGARSRCSPTVRSLAKCGTPPWRATSAGKRPPRIRTAVLPADRQAGGGAGAAPAAKIPQGRRGPGAGCRVTRLGLRGSPPAGCCHWSSGQRARLRFAGPRSFPRRSGIQAGAHEIPGIWLGGMTNVGGHLQCDRAMRPGVDRR